MYGVVISRLTFPEPVVATADVGELVPVHRQATVWLIALAAAATMPLDEAYLATVLAFAEVFQGFSSSGAALLGATFVAGGLVSLTALPNVIARTPMATLLTVSAFGLSAVMLVAAVGPGWVLVPVGLVHSGLLMATWLALQTTVLRVNPGREGATKVDRGSARDGQLRDRAWRSACSPIAPVCAGRWSPSPPCRCCSCRSLLRTDDVSDLTRR